jgi:hypothetical protein
VLKYGETPFSLKLMPNPGPNLILPLISAICLAWFDWQSRSACPRLISPPVDGIPPGVPVLPPVVARLAPLAILDGVHLHLKVAICIFLKRKSSASFCRPASERGTTPATLRVSLRCAWACKTSTAAIPLPFPKICFHHQR